MKFKGYIKENLFLNMFVNLKNLMGKLEVFRLGQRVGGISRGLNDGVRLEMASLRWQCPDVPLLRFWPHREPEPLGRRPRSCPHGQSLVLFC